MDSLDKQSQRKRIEKLVEIVGQYSLLENDEAEEAISLCREIGNPAIEALVNIMEKDIESGLDSDNSHRSDNAAYVAGSVGKMSIPALSSALHIYSYAYWALGIVARLEEDEAAKIEAADILKGELLSSNWMKVEAAVNGLKVSKDKSALPAIEAIRRSTTSFEIMRACDEAIQNLS